MSTLQNVFKQESSKIAEKYFTKQESSMTLDAGKGSIKNKTRINKIKNFKQVLPISGSAALQITLLGTTQRRPVLGTQDEPTNGREQYCIMQIRSQLIRRWQV